MNTYRKMYVICEDEYRRLTENKQQQQQQEVCDVGTQTEEYSGESHVIPTFEGEEKKTKKRYKCTMCDKDYSDKHDLRRHFNSNHKKEDLQASLNAIEADIRKVEPVIVVNQKTTKRKNRKIRRPPRDPFNHIIKKWRTL